MKQMRLNLIMCIMLLMMVKKMTHLEYPNLDTVLYFQYSDAIDEFKRALSDQAVNVCCSCERLLRIKSLTEAKNLDYIRENNPVALNKVMYNLQSL